jgi:hypothetical protein
MRAAKVFRIIWRINAVVILLAAVALLIAVISLAGTLFRRDAGGAEPQTPVVAATAQKEQLHLRPLQRVEETTVLRADLVEEQKSSSYLSKGGSSRTRNVLSVDIPSGKASWLFPTHGQIVETSYTLFREEQKTLADVSFVKALHEGMRDSDGRVVIIDPTARRSVVVAEHVTNLDSASVANGVATIVCQRGAHYVVITADPLALVKLTEREITIPQLR